LALHVEETPQLAPILLGLWVYYHVRAELQTAHTLGEALLRHAQTWPAPILLNQAHHVLGITSTDLGRFAEALEHLEQATALYMPEHHRLQLALSVYDTGVICRAFAAHNLWYLGYPDQAAQRTHEALALAQELGHPYTIAGNFCLAAVSAALRCEWHHAQEWAEAVITLSREHSFPYFSAWGTILRGSALSALGQRDAGIIQLRQGLAAYHAAGAAVLRTYWAVLLAEALARAGAAEEGLHVLDDADPTQRGTTQCGRTLSDPRRIAATPAGQHAARRSNLRGMFPTCGRHRPPPTGQNAGATGGDEPEPAVVYAG
jgi:predicted ATPase